MSIYRSGINGLSRSSVVVGLLPGYANMSETLRAMKKLRSEIKASDREMLLSSVSSSEQRENNPDLARFWLGPWSEFVGRFEKFYSDNSGWWDRFLDPNDIFNQAQKFRQELIDFRSKASDLGFGWSSPDPVGPDQEQRGLIDAGGRGINRVGRGFEDLLWKVAKFALVGVGIFALIYFIRSL